MPGFELFGAQERRAVEELFEANGGVLFAHGFAGRRNGIFRVRELEGKIARQFGAAYVQATSSGSSALWCAMRALGVGPGDEVVTQSFTFVATVEAILLCGAQPVVVDIDTSLNMDPAALAEVIGPRTRLIVPVHMAGVAARMDEIGAIAKSRGIAVLEDAAQAVGATYRSKPLGTIGAAGIYSLDFGKIVTCGEGGAVLTSREDLFKEVRCLHDHGHQYDPALPRGLDGRHRWGFNFRMTELQAALAMVQLDKLDRIVAIQRAHKQRLKAMLSEARLPIGFRDLPDPGGDNGDTLFIFTRAENKAAEIAAALDRNGIGTKNVPDALNWHFAGTWDHMLGDFYARPLAEVFRASGDLLRRTVAIPIWINCDEGWFERAHGAVADCFR